MSTISTLKDWTIAGLMCVLVGFVYAQAGPNGSVSGDKQNGIYHIAAASSETRSGRESTDQKNATGKQSGSATSKRSTSDQNSAPKRSSEKGANPSSRAGSPGTETIPGPRGY